MKFKFLIISIIVITLVLLLIGCDSGKSLSSSFSYNCGDEEMPGFWLDYKSDTREFDIDNVALDVYFGWHHPESFSTDYEPLNFKLVVNKDGDDNDILIREVIGFNSKEYYCGFGNSDKIEYSHSETVVIPKDLFDSDYGKIWIALEGYVSDNYYPGGGSNSFKYEKIGDNRVRLSAK